MEKRLSTWDALIYARASARVWAVIACVFLAACAAKTAVVARPAGAIDAARFSDLDRIDRIEVRRVNPRSAASEVVGLGPDEAFVRRLPAGTEKRLAVPKETLEGVAQTIRGLGDIVVHPNRSQQTLETKLVVYSGKHERSVLLDPEDRLHPVFDVFMKLREDVLKNGH